MSSSFIFLFIIVLFSLSYVVQYPDILNARIVITAEIPPIPLVSKSNGRIQRLFVKDNTNVVAGQNLILLESTSDYQEVEALSTFLNNIDPHSVQGQWVKCPKYLKLGNIQSFYASFEREYESLKIFRNLNARAQQLAVYNQQLLDFRQLLAQYNQQTQNLETELLLVNKDVDRTALLFKESVVAARELEVIQREPLRIKRQLEDVRIAKSNAQISLSNIERNIVELEMQTAQNESQLKIRVLESFQNLMSRIAEWQQTYLMKSPLSGQVTYFNFWSENQYVKQGDELFNVIPQKQQETIGKALLPIQNAGKLSIGQKAMIRLDNYPYTQYGVLHGMVKKISAIPKLNHYSVEIAFDQGLRTSIGTDIHTKNELQGNVSIVTEELRLIDRIFYQIRKLFV
jgi:multidrug resistance efflux pump